MRLNQLWEQFRPNPFNFKRNQALSQIYQEALERGLRHDLNTGESDLLPFDLLAEFEEIIHPKTGLDANKDTIDKKRQ